MAAKSLTEAVRDHQIELNKLISHLDGIKDEVRRANLLEIRDRLTKLEATLDASTSRPCSFNSGCSRSRSPS